jgi:hypothetical protein
VIPGSTDRPHDAPHLRDRRVSGHFLKRRKYFQEVKGLVEAWIFDRKKLDWVHGRVLRKNELLDTRVAS